MTSTPSSTANEADLKTAIGVASFFRSAADRIKRDDALADQIAAKKREVEETDPLTHTSAWVSAVLDLVDLVVESRSR